MRLLHSTKLTFEEFYDSDIPKYAILSHRWGKGEVSFQAMSEGKVPEDSPGLIKIKAFCKMAASRYLEWAWIDTCCIDKKSSAELTEAINSMYRWYMRAKECYIYLSDVQWFQDQPGRNREQFRQSEWFERGWTLQELLAPRKTRFFDCSWVYIGDRETLKEDISEATGIDKGYLYEDVPGTIEQPRLCLRMDTCKLQYHGASIAQRMSWVSKRKTSRVEDMAYCLLGLFNVNMPLLYGEGPKAFLRLQLEILKKSDDETIFAWKNTPRFEEPGLSVLAPWPSAFADCGNIFHRPDWGVERPPYTMTNKGLEFRVPYSTLKSTPKSRWTSHGYRHYRYQVIQLELHGVWHKDKRITLILKQRYRKSQWVRIGLETVEPSQNEIVRRCDALSREEEIPTETIYLHVDGFGGLV